MVATAFLRNLRRNPTNLHLLRNHRRKSLPAKLQRHRNVEKGAQLPNGNGGSGRQRLVQNPRHLHAKPANLPSQ